MHGRIKTSDRHSTNDATPVLARRVHVDTHTRDAAARATHFPAHFAPHFAKSGVSVREVDAADFDGLQLKLLLAAPLFVGVGPTDQPIALCGRSIPDQPVVAVVFAEGPLGLRVVSNEHFGCSNEANPTVVRFCDQQFPGMCRNCAET